jgi:hypothetical protein
MFGEVLLCVVTPVGSQVKCKVRAGKEFHGKSSIRSMLDEDDFKVE